MALELGVPEHPYLLTVAHERERDSTQAGKERSRQKKIPELRK